MKAFGTDGTKTERFRKQRSDGGDRMYLLEAEARSLYATWKHTNQRVLTSDRIEWLERKYGTGAVSIVRNFMDQMRNGLLD